MPRARSDENIFHDSTMTFGQHLEELRKCLFKAVLGLLGGLLVGFFVGGYVVEFIQIPLVNALKIHVTKGARERIDKELKELEAAKFSFPWSREQLGQAIDDTPVIPEMVWVPREQLAKRAPDAGSAKPKAEIPKADPPAEETTPSPPANPELEKLREEGLEPFLFFRLVKDDPRISVRAFNAHEAFMIWLKASLLVGVVLASPWIFYQIWSFVAAGLYPHEKRYVNIFLPFSLVLFLVGVLVAFFVVFEPVLELPVQLQPVAGDRARPADQRVAELRADAAAGLRHRLPVAAGDALPGADRRLHGADLPVVLAGGGPGDLRDRRDAHAARSVEHVADGRAADASSTSAASCSASWMPRGKQPAAGRGLSGDGGGCDLPEGERSGEGCSASR